jgi:hypothetical protein
MWAKDNQIQIVRTLDLSNKAEILLTGLKFSDRLGSTLQFLLCFSLPAGTQV